MPNTASAKKRLRQNEHRRLHNKSIKSTLRSTIRKVREAIAAGEIDKAEQEFRLAAKRLDKAGSSHIIHPNKAARLKSRLQKAIKKAKVGAPA